MSAGEEINNNKENFLKLKAPLYFSPSSHKKHSNLSNLYTEPRNIHQEIDSNLSKNQIKQKLNNTNINKNLINIQQQDNFRKNTKLLSEINDKINQNKKNPQSYKKVNSKLYLKKNIMPNIALNDISGNILSTQPNTNSNTNINNISNDPNNKYLRNKLTNIKFNIGKSSQNVLNTKNPSNNLKKNAGSAIELLDNNNYLRKSKTKNKNLVEINNINPIGYIYSSSNNQNSFLSPQNNSSNPKILFLKNEKSKIFDRNASKDSKIETTQDNELNNNDGEDKKDHINCLLRNTFTNVKIYPTTILNNKIIYNQIDKNNQNKSNNQTNKNSENSNSNNNNSSVHYNNSKIKKEKIVIDTAEKKQNKNKKEYFESIEELHYFYVDTLQRGKKYAKKLDK